MKQSTAIKRATQQARNAMKDLDAKGVEQLLELYRTAADEVRAQIRAAAGAGNQVQLQQLRPLLQQIDAVLDRLGERRDALIAANVSEAAGLGVRPLTMQGVVGVGGAEAVIDSGAASRINEAAVDFVMNFKQADGLQLSERLWKLNQGAKETLQRAIASAVIRGQSAARAAMELSLQGKPVPPELATVARAGQVDEVAGLADILTSEDGGELWKAERVLRTEINRAHGEAFMASAEKTPGFAGFRYLLSPAHPRPDICDLFAAQNIHGLGAGVYPTKELTPWPAHPNTLSFLEIVFEQEISAADRAGKETELQALQRLAPEIRAGVLGQTKAQYFDRGLLTKGMIRAPLADVDERISRAAAAAARPHPHALANHDQALIDAKRIAGYSLNPEHPKGKHKARVLRSATGFTGDDVDQVVEQLREQLPRLPAKAGKVDQYGERFNVDFTLQGPRGSSKVRSGWIFRPGSDRPELLTLYIP